MEDVKEHYIGGKHGKLRINVSILVLMEDVKEHIGNFLFKCSFDSFNPCFNGRCKRTSSPYPKNNRSNAVSILVLMEDVKEQQLIFYLILEIPIVSILVLMEDVKEHSNR